MPVSDLDLIREAIGDQTEPYKLSKGMLERLISDTSNWYLAAAKAARFRAMQLTTQARSKSIGRLSVSYGALASDMLRLAESLEKEGKSQAVMTGKPYAGGLDRSDMLTRREDTETLQTVTKLGMHDIDDPLGRRFSEELGGS